MNEGSLLIVSFRKETQGIWFHSFPLNLAGVLQHESLHEVSEFFGSLQGHAVVERDPVASN